MTTNLATYRREWFSNIRADILSGIVVALALIPEAIGFSVIAGVDPKVGLFASFAIACVSAFTGGRPGMISAATAATAVLMVTLVKEHGLEYLFAATLLMGLIQIAAGFLKLGRVMRFVSRSVITGFVNALAILIFMLFTQPANAATQNWTVQPENWEALRAQWEYSHLVNAAVNFLAFCCATLASTR